MAKITDLTELTVIDPDDLLYVVHAPATAAASMKAKAFRFGAAPSTNGFRLTLAPLNPVYAPQPATPSSTDTTADTCTFAAAHGWESGTIVTVSATIGGLTAGSRYFLNKVSTTVVSFHTTVAAALAGTSKVDLTATMTSQVIPSGISNSTIYLTPFNGAQIGLYNGSSWTQLASAEVSLALGTLTSDKNYDVFAYSNVGVLTLELLAWTSDTVRATALVRQDGVWVKTGALTRRYIGTIRTDSTTTTIMETGGARTTVSAKLFVWNADNRLDTSFFRFEQTGSWAWDTLSYHQANASTANQIEVIAGLAEAMIDIELTVLAVNTATGKVLSVALGEDSTTIPAPGSLKSIVVTQSTGPEYNLPARLRKIVPLGYHYYSWLEYGGGATSNFYSDDAALRRYGLTGSIRA